MGGRVLQGSFKEAWKGAGSVNTVSYTKWNYRKKYLKVCFLLVIKDWQLFSEEALRWKLYEIPVAHLQRSTKVT